MKDKILTREEAIELMKKGRTVSHASFLDTEWMKMIDGKIVFENGLRCEPDEFWKWRQLKSWDYYWREVEICYKSNEICIHSCTGQCKESC